MSNVINSEDFFFLIVKTHLDILRPQAFSKDLIRCLVALHPKREIESCWQPITSGACRIKEK